MADIPRFSELARPDETGLPLAWGLWGDDDQHRTFNRITPQGVAAAARLVRRGLRFNLDRPLHAPYGLMRPGAHRRRQAPRATLFKDTLPPHLLARVVKLDTFFPRCSSQWDGLTHMGDARHAFYNGVQDHQVTHREDSRAGIDAVARFGPAGRCVLVDLARRFEACGAPWHPTSGEVIDAGLLADCLAQQGVALQTGDVLLLRMGWVGAFLAAADPAAREALFVGGTYSGLSGEADMWEFLWDQGVAADASDTVTVTRRPIPDGRPGLHPAIARLGVTPGEMSDLDALAADCARGGLPVLLHLQPPQPAGRSGLATQCDGHRLRTHWPRRGEPQAGRQEKRRKILPAEGPV